MTSVPPFKFTQGQDIGTDTDRSATRLPLASIATVRTWTYLVYRFRDKQRFQSKITNFPHPVYFFAPGEEVPLAIGYRRLGQKKLE